MPALMFVYYIIKVNNALDNHFEARNLDYYFWTATLFIYHKIQLRIEKDSYPKADSVNCNKWILNRCISNDM